MIVRFEDYLLEELLNESMVNEKINLEKIYNFVKKVGDKTRLAYELIKKFNESDNILMKKHFATILIVLFFGSLILKQGIYSDASGKGIEKTALEIAKEYNNKVLNIDKIRDSFKLPNLSTIDSSMFKLKKPLFENIPGINIDEAKISYGAKEIIKEHEQLRLEAYNIGDGHITIGYGHASPESTSKYKLGDKITIQTAERLFGEDIKRAEDGVKRMLKRWEKENIDVKITQSMFDAMVSMAYNMGVYGFITCDFLEDLKNKNYIAAAEKIKTTRINGKVKNSKGEWETVEMPGLLGRRLTEFELFTKDIS